MEGSFAENLVLSLSDAQLCELQVAVMDEGNRRGLFPLVEEVNASLPGRETFPEGWPTGMEQVEAATSVRVQVVFRRPSMPGGAVAELRRLMDNRAARMRLRIEWDERIADKGDASRLRQSSDEGFCAVLFVCSIGLRFAPAEVLHVLLDEGCELDCAIPPDAELLQHLPVGAVNGPVSTTRGVAQFVVAVKEQEAQKPLGWPTVLGGVPVLQLLHAGPFSTSPYQLSRDTATVFLPFLTALQHHAHQN